METAAEATSRAMRVDAESEPRATHQRTDRANANAVLRSRGATPGLSGWKSATRSYAYFPEAQTIRVVLRNESPTEKNVPELPLISTTWLPAAARFAPTGTFRSVRSPWNELPTVVNDQRTRRAEPFGSPVSLCSQPPNTKPVGSVTTGRSAPQVSTTPPVTTGVVVAAVRDLANATTRSRVASGPPAAMTKVALPSDQARMMAPLGFALMTPGEPLTSSASPEKFPRAAAGNWLRFRAVAASILAGAHCQKVEPAPPLWLQDVKTQPVGVVTLGTGSLQFADEAAVRTVASIWGEAEGAACGVGVVGGRVGTVVRGVVGNGDASTATLAGAAGAGVDAGLQAKTVIAEKRLETMRRLLKLRTP